MDLCLGSAEVVDAVDRFFFFGFCFNRSQTVYSVPQYIVPTYIGISQNPRQSWIFPRKVMGKLGGAAKRRTGWQAWVQVCSFTIYPTCCEFSVLSKIVFPKAPKKQNQSFFWHSTFFTTSVIFQVSTAPGSKCYQTAPYCWWKKSG